MASHYQVTQPSTLLEGGVQAAAPAKINRFLHIVGRRDDGYHLLETGFQFVQWCDWIHFRPIETPGVHILEDPLGIGEQNLVFRAASLLLNQTHYGVEILIEKHLPSGGGLGGGSSDAATTLVALNEIFHLGQSKEALQAAGLTLGADVPAFIFGSSCFARGIGEKLTEVHWPGTEVLTADPQIHVPTRRIFQHPKLTRDTPSCKIRASQLSTTHNDCEPLVRSIYPAIDRLIEQLRVFGEPRLSGTGGCLFVVDPIDADYADLIIDGGAAVKVGLLSHQSLLYTCCVDT
jgi:4-diphosphocytidyl-2-C-methyl-D-erythritol kinase